MLSEKFQCLNVGVDVFLFDTTRIKIFHKRFKSTNITTYRIDLIACYRKNTFVILTQCPIRVKIFFEVVEKIHNGFRSKIDRKFSDFFENVELRGCTSIGPEDSCRYP